GVRVALESMHGVLDIFSTFAAAPENAVRQETVRLADRLWELLYRHLQRDLVKKESWDAIERKVSTLLKRFEYRGFTPREIAPEDLDDAVDLETLKAGIVSDIESLREKISEDEQLSSDIGEEMMGVVDEELDAAVSMLRTNGADFAMLGVNSPIVDRAVENFSKSPFATQVWQLDAFNGLDPDSLDGANLMNAVRHIASLYRHDSALRSNVIYDVLEKSIGIFVSRSSYPAVDALPFIAGVAQMLAERANNIPDYEFERNEIADTVAGYVERVLQRMPAGDIEEMIRKNQAGTRKEPAVKGGIDFNADFLDLRIGGEPVRPQIFSMNESFAERIGGLVPVIINITLVDNLPAFLMQ
ncbi:MAG TPA: hypothetical protein VLJ10_00575, partial [Candidatus Bathyarchaeia archaeon]|nr:hypothetical protein [Candidatus Bathyarchaeia archaeon]